jgi:hypothetical protein
MNTAILEQIVELSGDCLQIQRCVQCPFRTKCHTEFVSLSPPSKNTRRQMALDALTMAALFDEDVAWREKN